MPAIEALTAYFKPKRYYMHAYTFLERPKGFRFLWEHIFSEIKNARCHVVKTGKESKGIKLSESVAEYLIEAVWT